MKAVLFLFAWISFTVGIIGAFLPILPTTPFLILSAFLFSKSSPRFHKWLLELPVAGEGIRDWHQNRVIKNKAKVLCTIMMSLSVVLIALNPKIHFLIKTIASAILLAVWTFVITRKSRA